MKIGFNNSFNITQTNNSKLQQQNNNILGKQESA